MSIGLREKTLKPVEVFLEEVHHDYIGCDKESTHSIDLKLSYFDGNNKFREVILQSTEVE